MIKNKIFMKIKRIFMKIKRIFMNLINRIFMKIIFYNYNFYENINNIFEK